MRHTVFGRWKRSPWIEMPSEACLEPPPPGLLAGIEEFNQGEFFECHETLEGLWMAEPRQIRKLYQGILQIGVAFYHLRQGRYRPVVTLLERGSGYLRPFVPVCMGLDVAQLLESTELCLAQVKQLGRNGLNDFDWSLVPGIEVRDRGLR
jgi:predicted metal-dependent hydrolase